MSYWNEPGQRKSSNSRSSLALPPTHPKTKTMTKEKNGDVNVTVSASGASAAVAPEVQAMAQANRSTSSDCTAATATLGVIRSSLSTNTSLTSQPSNPISSSTPANSPTHPNTNYRTPTHNDTSDNDTSSYLHGFETPLGLGANHQLNDKPITNRGTAQTVCDEKQMTYQVSLLSKKVESLADITMQANWQQSFSRTESKLLEEINNLIGICKTNKLLDNLAAIYTLRKTLNNHLVNLKQIIERDQNISANTQIRASTLTPVSHQQQSLSNTPNGIQPLSNSQEPQVTNPSALNNQTILSRPKSQSEQIQEIAGQIKKISDIKANKRDLIELETRTNNKIRESQADKITKAEYEQLCQRICALELEVKRSRDLAIENRLQNIESAYGTLKLVAEGICEDNLKMSTELRSLKMPAQHADPLPQNQHHELLDPQPTGINVPVVLSERNSRLYNSIINTISPDFTGMVTSASIPHPISSAPHPLSMGTTPETNGSTGTTNGNVQGQYRLRVAQPGTVPREQEANPRRSQSNNRLPGNSPIQVNDQSSTDSSNDNYQIRRRGRLLTSAQNLRSLCQPLDDKLNKTRVIGLQKSTLPLIMSERKEISRELDSYIRSAGYLIDDDAISTIEGTLSHAEKWCTLLLKKYEEFDCNSRPVDSSLFAGLDKFTETSEISIYEFLKKFDTIMEDKGTKKERAIILYTQYLDETIQLLTTDIRDNIDGLKDWLIKRYGEPRGMCTNILKPLKGETIPTAITFSKELLKYFRHLNAAINRIKELETLPGMPCTKLTNWIESTDFLEQLAALLPDTLFSEMYQILKDKRLDMQNLHGMETFNVITNLISNHASMTEGMAKIGSNPAMLKSKTRDHNSRKPRTAAHNATELTYPNSDSDTPNEQQETAHHTARNQKVASKQDRSKQIKTNTEASNKQSTKSTYFPCCYPGHEHEIGECDLFFSFTGKKRKLIATGKSCFTCLKSYDRCKNGCKTEVPSTLICQPCSKNAADKGKSYPPTNILLCPISKHREGTSETEILTALKSYLRNFDPDKMAESITISHMFLSAHATSHCNKCASPKCNCTTKSLSRSAVENEKCPILNTNTGNDEVISSEKIIEEVKEDAFYVMQLLNLRGRDVLTFYDSGANQNMIKGEIAEDINLKVLNQRPVHVGVVGGGKVWTNYGTYGFSLGPTEDGYYYSLSAQGITSITGKFPHYDLEKVNRDTIRSKKIDNSTVLPKYIGGQEAGLLVGIKNIGLDPELQFQLPSGLGVFVSPLKDKFGSRICYGGPSHIFTDVNNKTPSFNHASMYFAGLISQYRNSPYPTLSRTLEMELDEPLPGLFLTKNHMPTSKIILSGNQEVYFSALDEEDMGDLGIPEKESNDSECHCGNELNKSTHFMKNYLPIRTIDDDLGLKLDLNLPDGHNNRTKEEMINEDDDYGPEYDQNPPNGEENVNTTKKHDNNLANQTKLEEQASTVEAFKATVPISKRKEYVDIEDLEHSINTRCEDCLQCKKCSSSNKSRMISLQEQMEQDAIKKSVTVDLEKKEVRVDLPFTKNPVEYMKKRHHGEKSNLKQAQKVYQSQCKKPKIIRDAITETHQGLVDQGFMVKRKDLPNDIKNMINEAGFLHYMPWHIAVKEGSLSTPYRMVVDASMTGLNEILAKGENRMTKITDILIRNRCNKYIWSSDISKLYNQLKLNPSAMPWGLFLFKDGLDIDAEPEEYVMKVAWYGVSSTGNQAHEALQTLTKEQNIDYPEALKIIEKDLYVDDVLTGTNDYDLTTSQIDQTALALGNGGFKLKYIVRSGEKPCIEASADSSSLKVLGYKWSPEKDILQPGFSEINFNKRKKGLKKPNMSPIITPEDVTDVVKNLKLTRRIVASKVAEIWDPTGLWEPFKLQLKLDCQALKGLDWDTELDNDLQGIWTERFRQFLDVPQMFTRRCIVPHDAVDPNNLRLVCISDAGKEAGGCAIYGGFLRQNGTYSSSLLIAKSKLMCQKIPRNELDAIRLMVETAESVKSALSPKVSETLYFTDSTIAMCWCHSVRKRMRMYTLFRVAEIRKHILGTTNPEGNIPLPLYHIDGKLNVADLITKRHNILPKDLIDKSQWQEGYDWMKLPVEEMPITTYQNLKLSEQQESIIDEECFKEAIMSQDVKEQKTQTTNSEPYHRTHLSCTHSSAYGMQTIHSVSNVQPFVDIIKYGWKKSLDYLSKIVKFALLVKHKHHITKGRAKDENCKYCSNTEDFLTSVETPKMYVEEAKSYLFRIESEKMRSVLPSKKLKSFILKDGIYYYESRLTEEVCKEDIDYHIFFDNYEIKEQLPVVMANSDLFFAYAIHVHQNIRPHSGLEATMREILKIMMPINNPRKIIQSIRDNCSKCRLILKKTAELRMMNHPAARTTLAPPFYICQADTVFGFKAQTFKNARKVVKIYAFIICCLLTGATNILTLEGLETRDILQALERHGSRYGMPSAIYVDNGTQLIALENASFSIKDLNNKVSDSFGMKIIVSNAKAHEERGRIESRVKIMRNLLQKFSINTDLPLSILQWETIFAKISNDINNVPIAKCTQTRVSDTAWDVITPNRLMLGRNNYRCLEGHITLTKGIDSENLLRKTQQISKTWYQIFTGRIHHLIPRPNKWKKSDPIQVGDICLFTFDENPGIGKNTWKLGRIQSTPKKNQVIIAYPGPTLTNGTTVMKNLSRNPRNISIISAADEIDMNTRKFFEKINGLSQNSAS